MEEKYISVEEFAAMHGVGKTTVYNWIHKGALTVQTYTMSGRKYYLILNTCPRPTKRSLGKGARYIANHSEKMRRIPIISLPWYDDQRTMEQIIDEIREG